MRWWNQWSRSLDGWVERRRRFQKTSARTAQLAGQETLARAGASIPAKGLNERSSLGTPVSGTASPEASDGGRT
jgi:hypothetical protein